MTFEPAPPAPVPGTGEPSAVPLAPQPRPRRRPWQVITGILAVLLAGGALALALSGGEQAVVTLSASDGVRISPSGTIEVAAGSTVTVTVTPTVKGGIPGLMVDTAAVALAREADTWTYELTADADHVVQATVAVLAPEAVLLDPGTGSSIAAIAPDQSSITFTRTTPQIDSLKPGSILVNSAGSGYEGTIIAEVVSVDRDGAGGAVVRTRPVSITKVVQTASVNVDVPLTPPAPRTGRAGGDGAGDMRMAAQAEVFDFTVEGSLGMPEGCEDDACDVTIDGSLSVAVPRVQFVLEMDWFAVKRFEATLSERASAEVSMALAGDAVSRKMQPRLIRETPLANVVIAIGPIPVWIQPGIDTLAGGSFEAKAQLLLKAGVNVATRVGPRFENGSFDWVNEVTAEPYGGVDLAASATAEAYIILRPRIRVDGVCDIFADVHAPYLRFEAGLEDDARWELTGGAELAEAGAKCAWFEPWTFKINGVAATHSIASGRLLAAVAPATPTPSSVATLAPETLAPATPAPATQAASPVGEVELPVIACAVERTGEQVEAGSPPVSARASVPPELAGSLALYFVDRYHSWIGPAGGTCASTIYANGGEYTYITTDGGVVSIAEEMNNTVAEWVCTVDPTAKAPLDGNPITCPTLATGESITSVGSGEARFTIGPGVDGVLPHGASASTTAGRLSWSFDQGRFGTVQSCSLPAGDAALCETIITAQSVTVAAAPAAEAPNGWVRKRILALPQDGELVGYYLPATPAVAIAPDGSVHAILTTATGLVYRTNASGKWKTVAKWERAFTPSIAVGFDDTVHIAFSPADGGLVYVSVSRAGASKPERLAEAGRLQVSSLTLDGSNTLYVTYYEAPTDDITFGPTSVPDLWVRTLPNAVADAWGDPVRVAKGTYRGTVAGLPGGGAVVLVDANREGRLAVVDIAPDGAKIDRTSLPAGFTGTTSDIAAGREGTVYVTTAEEGGVRVVLRRDGAWSRPAKVVAPREGIDGGNVDIGVDPWSGAVSILWLYSSGTIYGPGDMAYLAQLKPGAYPEDGEAAWTTSRELGADSSCLAAWLSRLAVGRDRAWVVMCQTNEGDSITGWEVASR